MEDHFSIGGSDAGAIVAGGEEWRRLWQQKTGRAQDDDLSNVLAVMMGHATEPFNRYWVEKQTERAVLRAGEVQRHPRIPKFLCKRQQKWKTTSLLRTCSARL